MSTAASSSPSHKPITPQPQIKNPNQETSETKNPNQESTEIKNPNQESTEIKNPNQELTETKNPNQETSEISNPNQESTETKNPNQESTDPSLTSNEEQNQEQEEEGECGFCLFMKGGECRETFINWEKCVEEGEKNDEDIVNKCFEATSALKKCMEAHPDYYGVILQAEKVAEQEVNNQLDQLKEEQQKEE
ncbi:hypothetical protein QVD17_29359 [Tagetes erecta]|uniref:GCK domain-containing protein n=1 Tax=Tagetes erecta TaxID=13708 RepID=A0AAD8KF25_TARER|nr:hypothetical protein QVD17_29359 [Tagetes erecta]